MVDEALARRGYRMSAPSIRFYTLRIGLLGQGSPHDSPFSLTEVRVLYEIAERHRPDRRDIGA